MYELELEEMELMAFSMKDYEIWMGMLVSIMIHAIFPL